MTLLTTVQAMVTSGCTPEQIAAVVAAHEDAAEKHEALKRQKKAQRQQRWRERHPDRVTLRNASRRLEASRDASTPMKEEKEKGTQKEKEERLPLLDTTVSSPRAEKANNFNELVDWFETQWNGLAVACGLTRIQAMTDTRIAHIRRRADDLVNALHFPDPQSGFTETFNRIRGSPWLRGGNGRAWKADVDWILTERNFLHIHEGKYAKDQRPEHHRR